MSASSAWSSGASGVVNAEGRVSPATRTPVVPITPGASPAASAIASTRYVVVVFPFVPVTATTRSEREGWAWKRPAAWARASRGSTTSTAVAPLASRASNPAAPKTAAAPAATAAAAKRAPSACTPGRAKNASPGFTRRESSASPEISRSVAPRTASVSTSARSSRSITAVASERWAESAARPGARSSRRLPRESTRSGTGPRAAVACPARDPAGSRSRCR